MRFISTFGWATVRGEVRYYLSRLGAALGMKGHR